MKGLFFWFVVVFGLLVLKSKWFGKAISWKNAVIFNWNVNVKQENAKFYWIGGTALYFVLYFMSAFTFINVGELIGTALIYLFYLAIGGAVIWLFYWLFTVKKGESKKDTDYGSAAWATLNELTAAGIYSLPMQNKEFLYTGGMGFNNRPGALLTIASSRSGKGACIIIPNLLLKNYDSFLVVDPKGENAFMTARYQSLVLGKKVVILDPWNEQGRLGASHGIQGSSMNPLDFIRTNPDELADNCSLMAEILLPINHQAREPFWDDSARGLLKSYLLHMVTEYEGDDADLWLLYKWLRLEGDERLMLWAEMKVSENEIVKSGVGEFLHFSKDSTTLASIVSGAQAATRFLESEQLRATLCKSDFNPYDLTDGGTTVYVILPERFFNTHGKFLRMVVGLCLRAANHKPNQRINFLIDEAGVVGPLSDIVSAYSFAAGQNIRVWTFFQSLNQIKKLYGEETVSIFTAAQHTQYFGVDCIYTAEYVQTMLGNSTISVENTSNTNGRERSTTISQTKTGRPLMTAEEVGKTNDIINIYRGENQKLKYQTFRWRHFDPSPLKIPTNKRVVIDDFEAMRRHFEENIDTMPQHRVISKSNPGQLRLD